MEEKPYSEDLKREAVACILSFFMSEWKKYRFSVFGKRSINFEALDFDMVDLMDASLDPQWSTGCEWPLLRP